MRNLKRVLSLALALVMVLGMMVITTSAATFDDDAEITNKEAVEVMYALGIVQGDGTGSFNPDGTFTRAGAAKVLAYMMLGADYAEKNLIGTAIFADVPADHWAAKYIAYCSNLEIIKGDGTGNFLPNGTLRVVDWAKLVLGAIGYDAAKYTGAGWEQKVKDDIEAAELDVVAITTLPISREDACWMALEAMKTGEAYSNGWYIEGFEEEFGYSDSYADAYIMAKAMDIANPVIKKHSAVKDALLGDVYGVEYLPVDADNFGVPGVGYEKTVKGEKVVDLFFANEKVAEYKGEVKGGKLFTDLGSPKAELSFTMYVDGVEAAFEASVAKDSKDAVKGDLIEVYANGKDAYRVVVVNNYAGTVSEFVEANEKEEEPAYIVVNGIEYETEDFAKGDDVLYTVANGEIQDIEKAEATVAGTPTKKANGAWTIGGKAYYLSEKSSAELELGEKGEWYVDANGKLIANKGEKIETPKKVYTYAVILEVDAVDYKAAVEGTLIGSGKDAVEAQELLKVKNADDSVEILSTAWEYDTDKKTGEVLDVIFVNGDFENGEYAPDFVAGDLVKYHVDKDGKVDEIVAVGEAKEVTAIKAGDVEFADSILTDDTVVFMQVGKKYEVVTGYKNVVDATITSAVVEEDKGVLVAVLLKGFEAEEEEEEGDDLVVYFADFKHTEEWDAAANKGEGAVVYVYENVYVDGVKTTLTFADELDLGVEAGLFAYNTETGVSGENLLGDEGVVALIQSGFFKADAVVYTDAKTVYYEISKDGLAVAAGLPAVKDFETTILLVEKNTKTGVAEIVYFSAVEIEE